MVDLSPLLTAPGNLILSLLVPLAASDDEARASLAVTIGLVFWLAVLLFGWLGASRLRRLYANARQTMRPADALILHGLNEAGSGARRAVESVSWPAVWGAAWRAEVVHLGLYVLVPLAWEGGRAVLIMVFFPLMMLGFGDKHVSATDGTLAHLRSPECWTFVGFCSGPRSDFLHEPVIDASTCVSPGNCAPGRALVPDSGGWLWKVLWALLSLAWIGAWRNPPESTRTQEASTLKISQKIWLFACQ